MKEYKNFSRMIITSLIFMYPVMYLNTYSIDHVYWSQTRGYMTLLMGSCMALVMLFYMRSMLRNKKANTAIVLLSAAVFSSSLYLVRSQDTVDDIAWMRAMIPHHSMAILTSRRAQITDPQVKDLAERIANSQTREIAEMQDYIAQLKDGKPARRIQIENMSNR